MIVWEVVNGSLENSFEVKQPFLKIVKVSQIFRNLYVKCLVKHAEQFFK